MNDHQIFAEARRHTVPATREAYLTRACEGDSTRVRRIQRLLTMANTSVPLLDSEPLSLLGELSVELDSGSGGQRVDVSALVLRQLEPADDGSLGRLAHYRILSVVGQGGFGVVLKALDEKLQRSVAIKVLSPVLSAEREHQERFLREARSVAAIRHENVVQIYAVEEYPVPYIVMEFVEGPTLHQRLTDDGPMTSEQMVRIAKQIALGLDAAHSKNIVHRDIKPANILLDDAADDRVVLTDFGLAFSSADVSLSQTGQLIGTPAYMAPEQITGGVVDCRTDLFSFGGVLYKMCSGSRPFVASNTTALLRAVTEDCPAPISSLQPDTSPCLVALIDRLLAKQPEQRPQSAMEVVKALDRCESPAKKSVARYAVFMAALVGLVACAAFVLPGLLQDGSAVTKSASVAASNVDQAVPTTLAAEQQIKRVLAEVAARNEAFDSAACTYAIENQRVTQLVLPLAIDMSPLAELTDLEYLHLNNSKIDYVSNLDFVRGMSKLRVLRAINISFRDLEPLKDIPLQELHLWLWTVDVKTRIGDLAPLRGAPLTYLNCGGGLLKGLEPIAEAKLEFLCVNQTGISSLAPIKGMPIHTLLVEHTDVDDLSVVSGMPLKELAIAGSKVRDLTPVLGAPLEILRIDGAPIDNVAVIAKFPLLTEVRMDDPLSHAEILRQLPNLQVVNDRPVDQLWADLEQQRQAMSEDVLKQAVNLFDRVADAIADQH